MKMMATFGLTTALLAGAVQADSLLFDVFVGGEQLPHPVGLKVKPATGDTFAISKETDLRPVGNRPFVAVETGTDPTAYLGVNDRIDACYEVVESTYYVYQKDDPRLVFTLARAGAISAAPVGCGDVVNIKPMGYLLSD